MGGGFWVVLVAVAILQTVNCQTTASSPPRTAVGTGAAPPGGDLSYSNFEYQDGNTAGLPGPAREKDGLDKGQVAGIVIGCVLFGSVVGALATLCWLKRKRLFPEKFGPCEHPNEAPPVGPIDVLRTGSKLDSMTKAELSSVKSFSGTRSPSIDVRASDRDDSGAQRLNRVDERFKASADRACDRV